MNNLDNLTVNYIELNYLDIEKAVVYESFSLLDLFGVQHYEGKYIDLIANSDNMHKEDVLVMFSQMLSGDLTAIITDHYITLNDADIRLNERCELVRFLFLMQSMEDYENIGYRLFAIDSTRNVIVDLICATTSLNKPRVMEIISDVDSALIYAMQKLAEDRSTESPLSHAAHDVLIRFVKYIGNSVALGNKLVNSYTVDIELKNLELALDLDISEHVDANIATKKTQVVLDILSLLLICKDSQNDPMGAFKEHSYLFTDKPENVTLIEPLLRRIYGDFVSKTKDPASAPSVHQTE